MSERQSFAPPLSAFERSALIGVGVCVSVSYILALSPLSPSGWSGDASLRGAGGVDPGYTLEAVSDDQRRVPRWFLNRFPAFLAGDEPASLRKEEFIRIMLPLILRANEDILKNRTRLLSIRDDQNQGETVGRRDTLWVEDMAARYGVEKNDGVNIDDLLARVDVIPVSLALAQAAVESAWGGSRFAQEGNAAFGQWAFNSGSGIKPLRRDSGKTHVVRQFPTLSAAVRSYAHNLNTHAAYREFRGKREHLRRYNGTFSGLDLVDGLKRYSARGTAYVEDIRALIKANGFTAYDTVRLADDRVAAIITGNR